MLHHAGGSTSWLTYPQLFDCPLLCLQWRPFHEVSNICTCTSWAWPEQRYKEHSENKHSYLLVALPEPNGTITVCIYTTVTYVLYVQAYCTFHLWVPSWLDVVKLHVHASEGRRERINHTSLYRAVETRSWSDAGEPLIQVVYNVEAGVAVFDTAL